MAIIDESTGGDITLDEAKKWTKNFRDKHPEPNEIKAHMFGKNIIHKILNQHHCVGMRIYYAIDDQAQKHLLLVGVDKEGNDQIPTKAITYASSENVSSDNVSTLDDNSIADKSFPCPTYCPTSSPLMQ